MFLCSACHRHVRERACPFCGSVQAGPPLPTKRAFVVGMKRSGTLAAAGAVAALATAACGGTSLSSPPTTDRDAGPGLVDDGGKTPQTDAGTAPDEDGATPGPTPAPCPKEKCPDASSPPGPVDSGEPDTLGGGQAYGVPVFFDASPDVVGPTPAYGTPADAGEDVMGGGVDYGVPFPLDSGHPLPPDPSTP